MSLATTPQAAATQALRAPPTPPPAAPGARRKQVRNLAWGLGFLAPNILGFLTFTLLPLLFSMVMAFTNWDLRLHNQFKDEPIRFVGLDNFVRLLAPGSDFYPFLLNTLYLMMAMPFGIAASLMSAILLSKDLRGGGQRIWTSLIVGAVLVASVSFLAMAGAGQTAMLLLLTGLAGGILIAGTIGGTTVYRTLFYLPHFTAGVATLLLWKKLYNPDGGPINHVLAPPLAGLTNIVLGVPALVVQNLLWIFVVLAILLLLVGLRKLLAYWRDGDIGGSTATLSGLFLVLPAVVAMQSVLGHNGPWTVLQWGALVLTGATALAVVVFFAIGLTGGRDFDSRTWEGVGTGLMLSVGLMTGIFVLWGFAAVVFGLPAQAATANGIEPPTWLADANWAKPAMMIMGFWGAIGSNTMLLYLAALTNVPQELYEAADIDGASRFQKFWNVTWPQLAPTTFFLVVMGVIGGLQGGFDAARVLTRGGPAGSTTTIAYMIYQEGFETGRFGFSSAAAWTLFLMVLIITLFNWKFGNKYVND